jgi:hypothetical protein
VVGVRPAPDAHWLIKLVADQGVRAAASDHSRRLIGQVFGWINHFQFQRDFVPYVLAKRDFAYFPRSEGHSTSRLRP